MGSMDSGSNVDILMLGHFAKDRLVYADRDEISSGGGVYYGSIALRRLGLRVAIVTRLHQDDFARLDRVKREGVQVFAKPAPQTSGIANFYDPTDLDKRVCKPLGFAGPFHTADIPNVAAGIYAIVPIIAGEVDLSLLQALALRGPVALDVQGFVRFVEGDDLVSRPWPQMAEGLAYVTFLKVDGVEAELLTGETDFARAVRRLSDLGPREIVLTQSSGLTVFSDGQIHQAPFTPRSLAGRTGRGDTCFATYLGRRLNASPAEACQFAAAVTTLKLEIPGPWCGTVAEAEALMASRETRTS